MLNPLITFTTDFGTSDHFAATMKAVVLSIAPRARIVDITHEVTAFEVVEGAYTVAQAYRYFPAKTIHVVVVDPGVGSARRPILAEMAEQYFVAPDNGVLSMVFAREAARVRHITNEKFMLQPVSPLDQIHGILFAGGGPMGLSAAAGVVRYLEEQHPGIALATAEATHRLPTKAHRARAAAGHEFCRAGRRRVQTRISWPPRASGFPFARSPGAIRLRCESFRAAHRPWER